MGLGGQRHVLTALIPVKRPGTQFPGSCMAAGHVWTVAENVAVTGIRTRIPKRLAIPTSLARPTTRKCEKVKVKVSSPLQALSGPEYSRKLWFPDYMTAAQDGGKFVSLKHRPPLPPGNAPGTHFCQRLSQPQGHSAIGRIMSMEKSNDTIWNRASDLPI
jgi:hypothetical protein